MALQLALLVLLENIKIFNEPLKRDAAAARLVTEPAAARRGHWSPGRVTA
jgi:hypothetical protein